MIESEISWLRDTVSQIPQSVLESLVAHRGFHCKSDSPTRPLENTLAAYNSAWQSGVVLCECDISLTTDGHLFLAHDETFDRLAMKGVTKSKSDITNLSRRCLETLTLKNGKCTPALLSTVLNSAKDTASGYTVPGLVVEIKHDPVRTANALSQLLVENPGLSKHVPIVMSFVLSAVQTFVSEYAASRVSNTKAGPLVMFLTSANPKPDERKFDICGGQNAINELLSIVKENALGGVYIEFQEEMLAPAGMDALRYLSKSTTVGVWLRQEHIDNVGVAVQLTSCGVKFVNTDLPQTILTTVC